MPNPTLKYYDAAANGLVSRYEAADVELLQSDLSSAFNEMSPLLELGCGSGREAAMLRAKGHEVCVTDGSPAMISNAVAKHPELGGSALVLSLPSRFPFATASFVGVYAIAVLMHLPVTEIADILQEVRRVLRPDGVLFVSVPSARDDVDENGYDPKGRLFTGLSADRWVALFTSAGFVEKFARETEDGLGRSGVRWFSFAFRLLG